MMVLCEEKKVIEHNVISFEKKREERFKWERFSKKMKVMKETNGTIILYCISPRGNIKKS